MINRLKQVFRPDSPYRAMLISLFTMGLGYGLYKGVINNYLSQIVGMAEMDRGVVEFFRELPGLFLAFILAALYLFSAERIYQIGAVIMLIGMGALPFVPADRVLVTLCICVYSLGEHIQLGMKNTLSLEYARPGLGGTALGIQNSMNNIGTLAGYLAVVFAFTTAATVSAADFRPFFIAATVLLLISAVFSLGMKGRSRTDHTAKRFYFRRKYTKYYLLEVFYGARKQVFFTFGPYVLIRLYGADARTVSLLFAVTAVAGFVCAPLVGRIIDRVGYKKVMIADTLILVIVCFFYGFAHKLFPMRIAFVICCINYVLDSVISLASMASNVYVQDLADSPEEVRATISTGISVNHLITVLIALFGGWIWQTLGVEVLFSLSAVLGLCNSAYAATVRGPRAGGSRGQTA